MMERVRVPLPTRRIVALIVCFGIILILISLSVASVDTGRASIIVDPVFGTISGPVRGPKWFFKTPWQYDIDTYVAIDKVDMWTDPDTGRIGDFPSIPSLTKDGLEASVDVSIRWSIDVNRLLDLYRNYPLLDWKERTIIPKSRQVIRDVIAGYMAIELIEKRAEVSEAIRDALIEELRATRSLAEAISIEAVDVRRIGLPVKFTDAIEAKLTAEQLMLAAEFERTRTLTLANATAQKVIIEASGDAKARIIRAEAMAEAIEVLLKRIGSSSNSSQLAELYVSLSLLKEIAETGENVYIILTPEGVPIIISPKPTD